MGELKKSRWEEGGMGGVGWGGGGCGGRMEGTVNVMIDMGHS